MSVRSRSGSRKLVATVLGCLVVSGVFVASAAATEWYYYVGSLTSGEWRDQAEGSACEAMTVSRTAWDTGAGAYGKAVLISPAGSWLAANESQAGIVEVQLSTDWNANKALCKNTTPWQVTVGWACYGRADYNGCV